MYLFTLVIACGRCFPGNSFLAKGYLCLCVSFTLYFSWGETWLKRGPFLFEHQCQDGGESTWTLWHLLRIWLKLPKQRPSDLVTLILWRNWSTTMAKGSAPWQMNLIPEYLKVRMGNQGHLRDQDPVWAPGNLFSRVLLHHHLRPFTDSQPPTVVSLSDSSIFNYCSLLCSGSFLKEAYRVSTTHSWTSVTLGVKHIFCFTLCNVTSDSLSVKWDNINNKVSSHWCEALSSNIAPSELAANGKKLCSLILFEK